MQKLPISPLTLTKNPQKSAKNLVDKNPAKIFGDNFKKILTKKL